MTEPRVVSFLVSELRLPPQERELLGREWWSSYAHAVIHRDGAFLFDNGVGVGNAEVEAHFSPRVTPIEDALAEHGISMGDVTGVANCYLHFDHSGQNAAAAEGRADLRPAPRVGDGVRARLYGRRVDRCPGAHLRGPGRRGGGRAGLFSSCR